LQTAAVCPYPFAPNVTASLYVPRTQTAMLPGSGGILDVLADVLASLKMKYKMKKKLLATPETFMIDSAIDLSQTKKQTNKILPTP